MAIHVLHCGGCGKLFTAYDDTTFYCNAECRQIAHRNYLGKSYETRRHQRPGGETPVPRRRSLSVAEAWAVLGDREAECLPLDSIRRKPRNCNYQ
jgi:hypothetical protein